MLERFKALASSSDDQLVMVDLGKGGKLYGYVRLVAADFFVVQEVTKEKGSAKSTKHKYKLNQIISYTHIEADRLPAPLKKVAVEV